MSHSLSLIPSFAKTALGLSAFALSLALSATSGFTAGIDAVQYAAGEKAFIACKACHVVAKGAKDTVGPNLYGVYGKKAGTVSATYKYSPGMKAYGAVWNDKTLDTYLTAPLKTVAGTKMTYAGMKDAAKRSAVIYYLKMTPSK